MTIDPETLMAYADGELDPLSAKRVERAMAGDPALAAQVERHRRFRDRLAGHFAPIAVEPVPDRLVDLVRGAVTPLPRAKARPKFGGMRVAAAIAASLAVGVVTGLSLHGGPVTSRDGGLYASAQLASALDGQVGGEDGAIRVAVSFRAREGQYCRVFAAPTLDGIACRDMRGWQLRSTRSGAPDPTRGGYAQAGSALPDLMAAAQDMMAGDPLDAAQERAARAAGWR